MFQYSFSSDIEKRPDIFDHQGYECNILLTHLGSNQDSAEPKSDVLPITPWVNVTQMSCKIRIIFEK